MKHLDNYLAYGVCGVLFVLVLWLNYVFLFPGADVIDNKTWRIRTTKNEYSIGETVVAYSDFTKLYDARVTESVRHIQCLGENGNMTKYIANTVDSPIGVPKGEYKQRRMTVIVPVVPHGSTCQLHLEATYRIRLIRTFHEANVSNIFEVK